MRRGLLQDEVSVGQCHPRHLRTSASLGIRSSGFRVFCFGEEVAHWDIEGVGDVDQPLVQNPAFAVFHIYEHVPSDPGSQR